MKFTIGPETFEKMFGKLPPDVKKQAQEKMQEAGLVSETPPLSSVSYSSNEEEKKAPSGLWGKGFAIGLGLLYLANSMDAFIGNTVLTSILFPPPLINFGLSFLPSILSGVCSAFGSSMVSNPEFLQLCTDPTKSDLFMTAANVWLYILVGWYYGFIVSIIGNLYFAARKRTEW